MSVDLPKPIADYFAAENGRDVEAMARCFAESAVVRDEGRTIKGSAAIKRWKAETTEKYEHTVEPLAVVRKSGKNDRYRPGRWKVSRQPSKPRIQLRVERR